MFLFLTGLLFTDILMHLLKKKVQWPSYIADILVKKINPSYRT